MEKQFVPYAEAKAMKELGFDETCFACFYDGVLSLTTDEESLVYEIEDNFWRKNSDMDNSVTTPLYRQALEWFRKEHGLYYSIIPEFYTNVIHFNWQLRWYLPKEEWTKYVISGGTYWYGDDGQYPTQEEAELATLRKMIERVKQQS